jgi:hypothetical protein
MCKIYRNTIWHGATINNVIAAINNSIQPEHQNMLLAIVQLQASGRMKGAET